MTVPAETGDAVASDGEDGRASTASLWHRRPTLVAWLIATAGWAGYLALAERRPLAFDGLFYWTLSAQFDPAFDVTDHSQDLRGYSFPFLLRLAQEVVRPISDDPMVVVRLISLAIVPALLCVLVPAITRLLSPACRVSVPRLLVLNGLFFAAWRLDLLHPLSDIPALTAMAVGIWLTLRSGSLPAAAGAGIAWGLAVNIRPAYLAAAAVGVAGLILVERDVRRLVARTAAVLVGVALVLLPQVAANLEHHDSASPVPVRSSNLTRLQLFEGVRLVRYETYVGAGPYPGGLRFEQDDLVRATGSGTEFESIGAYLEFVAGRPVPVGTVYVLHVVNGLDARFGGTYIEHLDRGVTVVSVVNYALLVSALGLLVIRARRTPGIAWRSPPTWFTLVLLASCAPAVTGAVEPRFLLPLHLTLLASLVLCARREDLPVRTRDRVLAVVGLAVAVAGLELAATASLDRLPEPPATAVVGSAGPDLSR